MITNNILAIIGLVLDIVGIIIVYFNTPTYDSTLGDYGMCDENGNEPKKSFIRKFTSKHGLILILIGFFLQLSNLKCS